MMVGGEAGEAGGAILRVDLTVMERVAAAIADLTLGVDDEVALAAGAARLAVGAASTTAVASVAEMVEATRAELREIGAATASLADGLREAARRYDEVDTRARHRAQFPP